MSVRPRPPGLLIGAGRVMLLTWRTQLLNKRMLLPLVLLCVGPFMALQNPTTGHVLQPGQVAMMFQTQFCEIYLSIITLLVSLLLATAAIGDELEDKTLVHLFVRPLRRSSVYFGKYGWAVASGWLGIALSSGLSYAILASRIGGSPDLDYFVWFLLVELLAIGVYTALFLTISLIVPFPMILGLIYGFVIEGVVASLPGYFARASLQFQLKSFFDGMVLPGRDLSPLIEAGRLDPLIAFEVLLSATLVCVTLGLILLSVREFTARLGKPS